jgi:hypothetical protein
MLVPDGFIDFIVSLALLNEKGKASVACDQKFVPDIGWMESDGRQRVQLLSRDGVGA